MKSTVHRQITIQALQDNFSRLALQRIVSSNLRQDSLRGQIGHDEFHFDSNAFAASLEYIALNRAEARLALEGQDSALAQDAFGRLIHTAQDFYAHTNYVALWLARFPQGGWPPPDEIDPLDLGLLNHSALRSGKLYYPLEVLSFIPFMKKIVLPFIPRDSHAWMNLDTPEQGPMFQYAYSAAVKRTQHEFVQTILDLPEGVVRSFCD